MLNVNVKFGEPLVIDSNVIVLTHKSDLRCKLTLDGDGFLLRRELIEARLERGGWRKTEAGLWRPPIYSANGNRGAIAELTTAQAALTCKVWLAQFDPPGKGYMLP